MAIRVLRDLRKVTPTSRATLLDMTLIAARHHKRSIALTMLLAWVFALLSGVANACLTEPRDEGGHAGARALQAHLLAPVAGTSQAADQGQHGEHAEKATCQKSCDASSQTLLKQLPKFDPPDPQVLGPALHRQMTDLFTAPSALIRVALAAVPPTSPPPRVQFSRLAL